MAEDFLLDQVFQALANPTRREILNLLANGPASVLEIANQFDISLNGVSKHLKTLEKSGLVERTVEGRTHTFSLRPTPLRRAGDWIAFYRPFWEERLDVLEALMDRTQHKQQENEVSDEQNCD
ncbi:MAG: metalloregulator ArsR/SmtB family transcription factor [Chloroflexota bacterium]